MKINKKILASILASNVFFSQISTLHAATNSEITKNKLQHVRKDKTDAIKKTKEIKKEISTNGSKLSEIQSELNKTLEDKVANEQLLSKIEEELKESTTNLKKQIVTYYMDSYSSSNSILELFMKNDSLSEYMITNNHLKKILSKQNDLILNVEDLYKKQQKVSKDIKKTEEKLKVIQNKLYDNINKLKSEQQYQENTIKNLHKEELELFDILVVQEEEERQIQAEILAAKENSEKESKEEIKQESKVDTDKEAKDESNTEIKEDSRIEVKEEPKNETKEDDKEATKEQSKKEPKVDNKEDKTTNKAQDNNIYSDFAKPVKSYRITSRYGYRNHPVTGERKMHKGIDLAAPTGTPTYSYKSGKVIVSKYSQSYGNYIVVDHGEGISTLYAHLSERKVSVGDKVEKGQLICLIGSTGLSTGPHLHFEYRVNSVAVNPEQYISF